MKHCFVEGKAMRLLDVQVDPRPEKDKAASRLSIEAHSIKGSDI